MKAVNWSTAVAFLGTVICVTVLAYHDAPHAAAFTGILGSLATAVLPALLKGTSDDK